MIIEILLVVQAIYLILQMTLNVNQTKNEKFKKKKRRKLFVFYLLEIPELYHFFLVVLNSQIHLSLNLFAMEGINPDHLNISILINMIDIEKKD